MCVILLNANIHALKYIYAYKTNVTYIEFYLCKVFFCFKNYWKKNQNNLFYVDL